MTDRRKAHSRIVEINNLLSFAKDNLTTIRRKVKNLDVNQIDTEYKEILRLFNEIDVYRQHIDYLDYIKNHPTDKE